MNLFRVIAIFLIVWLVIYMVKRALGNRQIEREEKKPQQQASEKVVRCARCGLHVPQSQALRDGDRFYCSPEHRDEDKD
jgi:uncharacterized protein